MEKYEIGWKQNKQIHQEEPEITPSERIPIIQTALAVGIALALIALMFIGYYKYEIHHLLLSEYDRTRTTQQ
jgi:energy-converting hydrogenase Eha subunit G